MESTGLSQINTGSKQSAADFTVDTFRCKVQTLVNSPSDQKHVQHSIQKPRGEFRIGLAVDSLDPANLPCLLPRTAFKVGGGQGELGQSYTPVTAREEHISQEAAEDAPSCLIGPNWVTCPLPWPLNNQGVG